MIRIFATLTMLANLFLAGSFVLGIQIDDPTVAERGVQSAVQTHFLTALAALCFAMLVHAIVLTYFMGTGRWFEETTAAYKLPARWRAENQTLKYRTLPWMVLCILLLVATGAFGAAADPASAVGFRGWLGIPPHLWHFAVAATTCGVNLFVNLLEYRSIFRNGQLVREVLEEVRRLRAERGLAV